MNPALLFWLFLKASLFSTGGMGNLPSLHADLIPRGWATDRQFAEALAVGQIAPGPNGFWVLSLGYFSDGVPGALLALLAITLPPLSILLVERLYRRIQDHPAIEGFMRGLGLAVVGIFAVILIQLLQPVGLNARSVLFVLASLGLGLTRRLPPLLILALAAAVGIALR